MGWTLGITMDNLMGDQCGAVVGLHSRDEKWLSGDRMNGVWYGTIEDASAHQHAMSCAPYGEYKRSPFHRLGAPWRTRHLPHLRHAGQMITFMNGLQYTGYKKYSFSCVGESACADSWGNALTTGEPSLSIPVTKESLAGCRMTRC